MSLQEMPTSFFCERRAGIVLVKARLAFYSTQFLRRNAHYFPCIKKGNIFKTATNVFSNAVVWIAAPDDTQRGKDPSHYLDPFRRVPFSC